MSWHRDFRVGLRRVVGEPGDAGGEGPGGEPEVPGYG